MHTTPRKARARTHAPKHTDSPKRGSSPTSAPPRAADLIAATLARGATSSLPLPSAEAMAELRAVIAHNDASSPGARVPVTAAIELLQSYGWLGKSDTALNALCARALGRRSFTRA